MTLLRFAAMVSIVVAQSLSMGGCGILLYSHYPSQVTVRDAETHAPILGASVSVFYPYMMELNLPKVASVVTDQQGVAKLSVADLDFQIWRFNASGYVGQEQRRGGTPPQEMSIDLLRDPPKNGDPLPKSN